MSKALIPFIYEGKEIRVIKIDGEPWFVAQDVANVLGFRDGYDAAKYLDVDEKRVVDTPIKDRGLMRAPRLTIASEAGLYRLILRSNVPQAKDFQRWVTHEVLPSIRHSVSKMTSHVSGEWKGKNRIHTPGGDQDVICLSEQGLYFYVNRSDQHAAIPWQKWVAGEVLPRIRKTGGYVAGLIF